MGITHPVNLGAAVPGKLYTTEFEFDPSLLGEGQYFFYVDVFDGVLTQAVCLDKPVTEFAFEVTSGDLTMPNGHRAGAASTSRRSKCWRMDTMGDIFICHTLYHVLIALVRALRSRPGKSTLVLSTCVPEAETLRAKLLDAAPDLWDAAFDRGRGKAGRTEQRKRLLPPAPPVPQAVLLRCPRGMCTSAMTGAL